jgi:divalent metal cation (Fe/Co/Zn/Cd) transporter
VKWCDIILKNQLTIHVDVEKDLKTKSQSAVARAIKKYINEHYANIQTVDLKFDVTRLREDMQSKTTKLMDKTFRKNI